MKDFGPVFSPQCPPCWHKDTVRSLHAVMPQFHLRTGHGKESSTSQQLAGDTPSREHQGRPCFSPVAIQHGCCPASLSGGPRGTESERWARPSTASEAQLLTARGPSPARLALVGQGRPQTHRPCGTRK